MGSDPRRRRPLHKLSSRDTNPVRLDVLVDDLLNGNALEPSSQTVGEAWPQRRQAHLYHLRDQHRDAAGFTDSK